MQNLYESAQLLISPRFWRQLTLALAVLAWLITPALAYAHEQPDHCSCQNNMPPAVAFERAQAVFQAQVTSLARPNDKPAVVDWLEKVPGVSLPSYSYWRVGMRLTESWKGLAVTEATILTWYGASCGASFKVGGQYIVYANDSSVGWRTSACDGTTDLSNASYDLQFLKSQPLLTLSWPLAWQAAGWMGLLLIGLAVWSAWHWLRPWFRRNLVSFQH